MSTEFKEALTVASQESDSKQKAESFDLLLSDAIERNDAADLKQFVDTMANESTALFVSRAALQKFADALPKFDADLHKEVALHMLDSTEERVVAFEEQVAVVRENLANIYQDEEDFREAARVLIGIPLDSGQRLLEVVYKVKIYVRIARLFLEEDDSVSAERYLNRASEVIHQVKDKHLLLAFRGAFVRILDYKRQFLKAALKYYQMSQDSLLSDEGQGVALDSAHKCAILAQAGPQRQRLLATLYKDERSSKAQNFLVLEKMYLDRIITKREVESFAKQLQEHQLALLSDGSTVLDRAVIEHNVLSASRLYQNIGFDQLASLLELSAERAEKVAAKMMMEERLQGSIDQVARMIYFQTTLEESNALARWDGHIRRACSTVNQVLEDIAQKNPTEYAALIGH